MKKENTESILHELQKQYVKDPCNKNQQYLRNKIRNKLLPLISSIDSRFEKNILKIMDMMQLSEEAHKQIIPKIEERPNIKEFLSLPLYIQLITIEKLLYNNNYQGSISSDLCLEIIRFLKSKKGGCHTIKNIQINKKKNKWWIIRNYRNDTVLTSQ